MNIYNSVYSFFQFSILLYCVLSVNDDIISSHDIHQNLDRNMFPKRERGRILWMNFHKTAVECRQKCRMIKTNRLSCAVCQLNESKPICESFPHFNTLPHPYCDCLLWSTNSFIWTLMIWKTTAVGSSCWSSGGIWTVFLWKKECDVCYQQYQNALD